MSIKIKTIIRHYQVKRRLTNIRKLAIVLIMMAGLSSMGGEFLALYGQLKPTGTLSSGMVIQRQQQIPLWGIAGSGAKVYARMNGATDSVYAGGAGDWGIHLPSMEAGGPYELLIWSDNDTLHLTEIYVGDLWLASGQSNMAMRLEETNNASEEITASENPRIRQYLVTKSLGNEPREQPPSGSEWMQADPEHSGIFSAVGYYFAKHLHEHLNIPIGIINSSYGGTRLESWMSKEMLGYDEQDIVLGDNDFNQPTVTYNTMLHPLIHTPIKGVIWYQGESNMGSRENALMYSKQQEKMIISWRELWGMEDLPFIWVQLPNIGTEANESSPGSWDALPMLRAAQSRTLSLNHTGEAAIIDLGEIDIHPTLKEPVGKRLSLVARNLVYGDTIESSGPRYKSHRTLDNGRIELVFDHLAGGLLATETGDQSLRWFQLAGSNGTFYKANAVIVGDRVEVWNTGIPDPEHIRYAWEHNPFNTNFYNLEDLPAVPFKVKVNHPGFKNQSFKSVSYKLDKGESTLLTWEWSGAEGLLLNGIPVDSIGGWRIWPEHDSTFILKAWDRDNPDHKDSVSLKIRVQEPNPTIDIFADKGYWITPGTDVKLRARVTAPLGGTVSLVEFYANGNMIASITEEPFETTWTAELKGIFELYGEVTNQMGMKEISDSIKKLVDEFETLRFEAEEAEIKGGKWIIEDELVSGGHFVELTRDWTITFAGFDLDSSQTCQLSFSSMLNYGSPKKQYLFVNEQSYSDLVFEAPDQENWHSNYLLIPLDTGTNQFKVKANWGYMRMDYMELMYKPSKNSTDTTTSVVSPSTGNELFNYPNPFHESTRISFSLPGFGEVRMELFDISGKKAALLLEGKRGPGTHQFEFHRSGLENGTYILWMTFGDLVIRKKLIIF